MLYGLTTENQLKEHISAVVNVIGGGATARSLLMETAAAETDLGKAVDLSWFVGIGVMQFDKIGFDDVKQRTNRHVKNLVLEKFGMDVDRVEHTDLRWSPLLSVLFARLKYRLIPAAIPVTIEGRAAYWKRWYNSSLGKGTPEHYLEMAVSNGLV